MSRWKYPFKRKEDAEKHLRVAEREMKKPCFVKKFTVITNVYKIFSSRAEYLKYKKEKGIK